MSVLTTSRVVGMCSCYRVGSVDIRVFSVALGSWLSWLDSVNNEY